MKFDDLKKSLAAVSSAVEKCLDENNNFLPSKCGHWENAHDTGRWWEAYLMLENSIGFRVQDKAERAMKFNIRAMTNNPYGLLLNMPGLFDGEDVRFQYHNLREAMLAYTALVRFRGDKCAEMCGEKLIDTIEKRFYTNELTDAMMREKLDIPEPTPNPNAPVRPVDPYAGQDETEGTGRAIEGVLQFYLATGSGNAKRVLDKMAEQHIRLNLNEDGIAPDWMTCKEHCGHNHSYLGTLRGLLLYGIEFGNKYVIESVYRTYKNSIFKHNCSHAGFAPHDLGMPRFNDGNGDPLGDHASCADVIYIAYLLAAFCGYEELYDDVERLIRARLFRLQEDQGEFEGAWGIIGEYFGHGVTVDVFCLTASTLCGIYNGFVKENDDCIYIPLYFSRELDGLKISAERDEKQHLTIEYSGSKAIRIRLPEWCPRGTLSLKDENAADVPYTIDRNNLYISAEAAGAAGKITLSFDLPEYENDESTWYTGIKYRIFWRGDDIISWERYNS